MRQLSFILVVFFINLSIAMAQEDAPDITVEADVCEKIAVDESKSSARERASDKASFKAVEDIPLLSEYKAKLDSHNFNLKVYRLIDNYLEDLNISVTDQDDKEVCVHVSAFLSKEAIEGVFNNTQPQEEQSNKELALDIETTETNEDSLSIPPKPQIIIHKDIAYSDEVEDAIAAMPEAVVYKDEEKEDDSFPKEEFQEVTYDVHTKVFVDKTEFYDGSQTDGFFPVIAQTLNEKSGVVAISEKTNPDYLLKTKVLKAKVDNINSQTRRLQMVVAVDLINTNTSETFTEHQNRFVLFDQDEDSAQKTASKLAKDLFEDAVAKVLPKIKTVDDGKETSIITPR